MTDDRAGPAARSLVVTPDATASEEDQRRTAWMSPGSEGREGTSPRNREGRSQEIGGCGDGLTIQPGVGDDQQDVIDSRITSLQRQSTQQGLDVVEPSLGVDRETAVPRILESRDPAIPRPLIASDGQGHLVPQQEADVRAVEAATGPRPWRAARP
jgi:hypothetical protein